MDHRQASQILHRLSRNDEDLNEAGAVAADCARLLLKTCRESGYRAENPAFQLLCRLATAPAPGLAAAATTELYREVIEPLCDDFTRAGSELAHQVLAGLIAYLAETDQGRVMAKALRASNLTSPTAMLAHWRRAVSSASFPSRDGLEQLEKILIPSRITAGADVVITSVLLARLCRALPQAEIVLVGPPHLTELFSDLPGVRHLDFSISRHGALGERLLAWPLLLGATAREIEGTPPNRVLVIDSDSRLTQLGLLPMTAGVNVCQFPSQTMAEADHHQSLSSLTNLWLDGLLGRAEPASPFISPPAAACAAAASFCSRLRTQGAGRLLLVNLGVGGNDRKRLPEEFEHLLLSRLRELENTTIILDTGCGSEEKGRAAKLLGLLNGTRAPGLDWQPSPLTGSGLIGLCSSLGELAATCRQVDGYLGYDSCGQHLANGAGTPGVTVFAGHPNRRFLARWSPWSRPQTAAVIPVDRHEMTRDALTAAVDRALLALNHLTASR